MTTYSCTTIADIQNAMSLVLPGDIVAVSPGVYAGGITLSRSGLNGVPITLDLGDAIFNQTTQIKIQGGWWNILGGRFMDGTRSVSDEVIRIEMTAHDNLIQGAFFTNPKSACIRFKKGATAAQQPLNHVIDLCTFIDIPADPLEPNKECVQIGDGTGSQIDCPVTIKRCFFNYLLHGQEIISVKNSRTIVEYCVARDCAGRIALRGGNDNIYRWNTMDYTDGLVAVFGDRHVVEFNVGNRLKKYGVALMSTANKTGVTSFARAANNCIIRNNVIANTVEPIQFRKDSGTFADFARGNVIQDNNAHPTPWTFTRSGLTNPMADLLAAQTIIGGNHA